MKDIDGRTLKMGLQVTIHSKAKSCISLEKFNSLSQSLFLSVSFSLYLHIWKVYTHTHIFNLQNHYIDPDRMETVASVNFSHFHYCVIIYAKVSLYPFHFCLHLQLFPTSFIQHTEGTGSSSLLSGEWPSRHKVSPKNVPESCSHCCFKAKRSFVMRGNVKPCLTLKRITVKGIQNEII